MLKLQQLKQKAAPPTVLAAEDPSKMGGMKQNSSKEMLDISKNQTNVRLQADVAELEPIPGVDVDFPDTNNLKTFYAKVTPSEGLYKGATFKFKVDVDSEYPYKAPRAECQTLIYHPNIDFEGHVCLNILRDDWKPILTLSSVLFGLLTLFLEPNPDDPLNAEASKLMIDKPQDFEKNVKNSLRGGYVLGRTFPKLI